MQKGAYRPIHPSLIGRDDDEHLGFTSQSGKTAVYELLTRAGYQITIEEAVRITPAVKEQAEKVGELPLQTIVDIYTEEIFNVKGPFKFISFKKLDNGEKEKYNLSFKYNGKEFETIGHGDGPLESCLDALSSLGYKEKLLHYEQAALGEDIKGVAADAMTIIHLASEDGTTVICRGKDPSTAKANVKAIFNGLNLLHNIKNAKLSQSRQNKCVYFSRLDKDNSAILSSKLIY
ncbi:MAG: hypothetical protein MZU97_26775 [Bacillus subtilis]|nr:hypothetical protein [Bacillus subtilis]